MTLVRMKDARRMGALIPEGKLEGKLTVMEELIAIRPQGHHLSRHAQSEFG